MTKAIVFLIKLIVFVFILSWVLIISYLISFVLWDKRFIELVGVMYDIYWENDTITIIKSKKKCLILNQNRYQSQSVQEFT